MFVGLCLLMVGLGLLIVDLCGVLCLSSSALFSPFSYPGVSVDFVLCFDLVSLVGVYMLVVCSSIAFVYCFHYFSESLDAYMLFGLMVWFVGVMCLLMFSSSLVFSLVMWEYLGFVSFLLILFYSNMSSMRASLITLFSSRFGDVALFGLVAMCIYGGVNSVVLFLCFLLVVITKSASFPFISWLLEAMRAPTPVSSLVHSSTLVAAGVWFITRYGGGLPDYGYLWLFVGSILTVMITGVCAVFFVDLKKIVALSTCNNIAWCLVYYCCGDWILVLFQLVVHGLSKCVLFMLVGDVMSSSGGAQVYLGVYSSRYGGVYGLSLLSLLIFSLCGLPFLGIFFVKHFFLVGSVSSGLSLVCVFMLFVGFFISYVYSSRFMLILSSVCCGSVYGYIVSFLLISVVSFLGSLVGVIFVESLEEVELLTVVFSVGFVFIQVIGLVVGYIFYSLSVVGSFWDSVLWGNDGLVGLCYGVFDSLSSFCVVSFYRWEVALVSSLVLFLRGLSLRLFLVIFSFNFVVVGVVYYIFMGVLLC